MTGNEKGLASFPATSVTVQHTSIATGLSYDDGGFGREGTRWLLIVKASVVVLAIRQRGSPAPASAQAARSLSVLYGLRGIRAYFYHASALIF